MLARRLLSPARALPALGLAVMLSTVIGASDASAAIPWSACPTAGFECAHVDVPLDRTGATAGNVSLAVSRVPASSNPNATAVVPLAGGPGQAALPLSQSFLDILKPAIADRDLLIFDQRGTGMSGALSCASLRTNSTVFKQASG